MVEHFIRYQNNKIKIKIKIKISVGLQLVLLFILSENETGKYKNMDIKSSEQLYMIKLKHSSILDLTFSIQGISEMLIPPN